MYQVHLAVVTHIPELTFTQALGPRDELDLRTSTGSLRFVLNLPLLSLRSLGPMLHGDSSTPHKCGGYVRFVRFSVSWITPVIVHDLGEIRTEEARK